MQYATARRTGHAPACRRSALLARHAVPTLLALVGTAAQAAPSIDVSAALDYTSGGLRSIDDAGSPAWSLTATDAQSVAISAADAPPPTPSWWALAASADASGQMHTMAGSAAPGVGSATASWHSSFVNDSGAAQAYEMDLLLTNGRFGFSVGGATDARDFLAGFTAQVSVNGSTVWSTGQTFRYRGPSSFGVTKTGTDIGTATRTDLEGVNTTFELASYATKLQLGSFADGAGIDVVYTITSTAHWNDPRSCSSECAGVYAQMDDPFGIDGRAAARIAVATPAVPEPASAALLAAGLLATAGVARRRATARPGATVPPEPGWR